MWSPPKRPAVLGEPLLIIGRQVAMDEGKDRIDLLALDTAGSLVGIGLEHLRPDLTEKLELGSSMTVRE